MKKLISFILIVCFVTVGFLSKVSDAGLENGNIDAGQFVLAFVALMSPIIILGLMSSHYSAMQSGWIEADKGKLRVPFLYSEATAFLGKRKIIMKENAWVYLQPERFNQLGVAYAGERYYIEKERVNEQGTWYQIKLDSDHLITEESK